jgi:PTS system mannose-specific IIA component
MIGIVVVTHGQLARELVAAAEMITGEDIPNATSVSIGWHDSPDDAQRAIVTAVERVSGGQGAVILTDMFGGTPSNLALSLLREGQVEVVTGVNLPMLIRLVSIREEERVGPRDAARAALFQGKENIYLASELLGGGLGVPSEGGEAGEATPPAPGDPADNGQS